jgi:hypothetical protein
MVLSQIIMSSIVLLASLMRLKSFRCLSPTSSSSSSRGIARCLYHHRICGSNHIYSTYFQLRQSYRGFCLFSTSSDSKLLVNALPDCKRRLSELQQRVDLNLAKGVLDVNNLKESVKDMELESAQPSFWDDPEKAQSLLAELTRIKTLIGRTDQWKNKLGDISTLIELSNESPDDAGRFLLITLSHLVVAVMTLMD